MHFLFVFNYQLVYEIDNPDTVKDEEKDAAKLHLLRSGPAPDHQIIHY